MPNGKGDPCQDVGGPRFIGPPCGGHGARHWWMEKAPSTLRPDRRQTGLWERICSRWATSRLSFGSALSARIVASLLGGESVGASSAREAGGLKPTLRVDPQFRSPGYAPTGDTLCCGRFHVNPP